MKKTFVLGVGAQKCGTTWLYSYLNSFSYCDLGLIKEYHIWDKDVFPSYCVTEESLISSRHKPKRIEELRVRYALQNLEGFYEAYFLGLASRPNVRLTGDISPGYSALSASDFARINDRLKSAGFHVKVVFLMRDPVERIWSAARMGIRNSALKSSSTTSEAEEVLSLFNDRQYALRSRYDLTIQNIESVFSSDDIYFGFYENLFSETSVREISDFLDVEPNHAHTSVKVNVSKKTSDLPVDVCRKVASYYSDVYRFCSSRFPIVEEIWNFY